MQNGWAIKDGPIADSDDTLVMDVTPIGGRPPERVSFFMKGTHNGYTINFEVSYDGGTSYLALDCGEPADTSAADVTQVLPTANTSRAFTAPLPPGATHVRMRASAATSGSLSCQIAIG